MSADWPDTRQAAWALLAGGAANAQRTLEELARQGNGRARAALISRGLEGGSAELSGHRDKSEAQRRVAGPEK